MIELLFVHTWLVNVKLLNVSSGVVCMPTVLCWRAEEGAVAVAASPFQPGGAVLLAVPVPWGLCLRPELLPAARWVPGSQLPSAFPVGRC